MKKVHLCVLTLIFAVFSSAIYGATGPSEAYIRGDGTMVVNGKSFFPIGVRPSKRSPDVMPRHYVKIIF